MIQAAKIAPIDFVQASRRKEGYVSSRATIDFDLVSVSSLPNKCYQIFYSYALVQLDNATLARNFIDAIANDWATKKSRPAQEAMEAVRNRDLQREVKRKQQLHNAE